MKRSIVGMLAALALAFGARAIPAPAADADISLASHAELMSVLEEQNARISELEAGLSTGDGSCNSCNSCNPCNPCDCCHSTGLYVQGEITFLRYHRVDGVRSQTSALIFPNAQDIEFDFEASPRITVGYVFEDGLGIRTRWWDYDHANSVDTTAGLANVNSGLSVDTYTWDLEVFDTFRLNRNWALQLSGGVRYNEFDENFSTVANVGGLTTAFTNYETDFAGFGGLVGAQLWRDLGDGFSVFMTSRGSILMDDTTMRSQLAPLGIVTFDDAQTQIDHVKGIWEMQLGVAHSRDIGEGASIIAHVAAEYQMWMNYGGTWTEDVILGPQPRSTDVGFGGVVFGIGVVR